MIVIEGPDASGKTTLARALAATLGLTLVSSEGPPRYPGDIPERLRRYDAIPGLVVYDRHPCVSDSIYAHAFSRYTDLTPEMLAEFYDSNHLFIYCDPITDVQHVEKPHDTKEHLEQMHKHHDKLLETYRAWAFHRAHILYRIGDSVARIQHFVTDYVQDIADFHERFDIAYHGPPRQLPSELRSFRIKFLAEELCEYAGVSDTTKHLVQSALELKRTEPVLSEQFDALVDLVYVALGTAYMQGFPFAAGWSRVQQANMLKVRATHAVDSKRGSSYDVVKPQGWQPPDLTPLAGEDFSGVDA